MLPDTDGFDVCRRLRGDPSTRSTPIVMVTALNGPPYRQRGYRVGANAYVTKPYGPDELFRPSIESLRWQVGPDRGKVHGEIQVELPSESPFLMRGQRVPHRRLPGDPARRGSDRPAPPVDHGDGPERDRVGQSPPRRGARDDHLSDLRRPRRGRHPRPGLGIRSKATSPMPRSPTTRSPTWTSERSWDCAREGSA